MKKTFLFKLLIFQTIFYALIWFMFYLDSLTNYDKILWKPMVITFYSTSVIITFIIPMIKEIIKHYNNRKKMKKTFNGDYKFRGFKIILVDNRYRVYDSSGKFVFSSRTLKDAQNEISKNANELKKAKI